jgi:hypothetical protein
VIGRTHALWQRIRTGIAAIAKVVPRHIASGDDCSSLIYWCLRINRKTDGVLALDSSCQFGTAAEKSQANGVCHFGMVATRGGRIVYFQESPP